MFWPETSMDILSSIAIAKVFLPAITEHECAQLEREILALPVRKGGLGVTNPC